MGPRSCHQRKNRAQWLGNVCRGSCSAELRLQFGIHDESFISQFDIIY